MRLWRRRASGGGDEDEELASRMMRLSRKPRINPNDRLKPSKESVRIYVDNGLRILEAKLRELGATNDEVRAALKLGRETLLSSYPEPIDLTELANQLLHRVRTPRRGPRS